MVLPTGGRTVQTVDLIISNASELVTCTDPELGIHKNGWLAIKAGLIVAVGSEEAVLSKMDQESVKNALRVDATNKTVLPGFVDSHTHLVFGGDRLDEDAARIAKESPQNRKDRGLCEGMPCSMRRTRECSPADLLEQSAARLKRMIANGATTIECKSGYGLCLETELLQLETTQKLAETFSVDLISTFLGAHGWPDGTDKERYLDQLEKEMIPVVAEKNLVTFCDIWVDEGYFTAKDAERVLRAGLKYGLRPKIHAEAYSYVGASDVAAELHAVSSDHLNYTPPSVMQKLSRAGVVAVLAPCTDYVVRHPVPANPRLMIENGLDVAVATNCNPGCWCTSLPFALQIACRLNGLTIAEALRGATVNGAKAVGLNDRGTLAEGQLADIQIWDVPRHEAFFYQLGDHVIESVFKRGKKIFDRRGPFCD